MRDTKTMDILNEDQNRKQGDTKGEAHGKGVANLIGDVLSLLFAFKSSKYGRLSKPYNLLRPFLLKIYSSKSPPSTNSMTRSRRRSVGVYKSVPRALTDIRAVFLHENFEQPANIRVLESLHNFNLPCD